MAERWTNDDIERMEWFLHSELMQSGLIPSAARVHIQRGSRTYGRAWRLHVIREDSGAHYNVPCCPDYLGWTGAEARNTCAWIADILRAARRVNSGDEWYVARVRELDTPEAQA